MKWFYFYFGDVGREIRAKNAMQCDATMKMKTQKKTHAHSRNSASAAYYLVFVICESVHHQIGPTIGGIICTLQELTRVQTQTYIYINT